MNIVWKLTAQHPSNKASNPLNRSPSFWKMLKNSEISKNRFIELFCDPGFQGQS